MKKLLLSGFFAALAVSLPAQNEAPEGLWGNMLDSSTSGGDQASGIAVGPDGTSYWLTTMGSTASSPDILLNNELLFKGEPYSSGNSQTNNLCLLAFNENGAKKWLISSTSGDYANNQGDVAVDADGNVVFTAKVRHGDFLDKQINIVDAYGTVTEFGGTTDRRSCNLLVAKASADGKLLWHRYVTFSTVPGADATKDFIADGFKSTALAVDPQGNIYVGGNYSADMTVGDVTLKAANIADWSGDSQKSSGNMFILKFASDGSFVDSAIGSDGITMSQISALEWSGNSLYVMGTAQGSASMTFGGKEITPAPLMSIVLGKLDAALNADWMRCLPGSEVAGACVMQNSSITVVGSTLWFTCMFNGKISDALDSDKFVASVGKAPREGCLIKIDALSGEWLAGTTSRAAEFTPATAKTGLQGYLKVLQNVNAPAKCYVIGYVMNATVGIFLREYNAQTLEANVDHAWSLATQGGVPSCTAVAYDPQSNSAFISARGNKAFSLIGSPAIETVTPGNWAVLCAKFSMPDDLKLSAVDSLESEDSDAPAEYYNLQGLRVEKPQAGGFYILRQGSKTSKIRY